jgi:hypothetical protein
MRCFFANTRHFTLLGDAFELLTGKWSSRSYLVEAFQSPVLEHWRAEKNAGLKASIHVPELSQHSGSFTEVFASSKGHKSRTRYRSGVGKFFGSGRCTAVAERKANMFRRLLRKTANCSSTFRSNNFTKVHKVIRLHLVGRYSQ